MGNRAFDELSRGEKAVVLRYAEMIDEADRAWSTIGIIATVGGDLGVILSDATDPGRTYASLPGGMYFGLSCYLQDLLDEPDANTAQIRSSLLGAL